MKTEIEERYTLTIEQDTDPEPWDDWEHIVKIVHWHRQGFIGESIIGREKEWYEEHSRRGDIIARLYLYQHSGQSVSLGGDRYPFNDVWDSGQVGFMYVEKETAKKECGRYWKVNAMECIQGECKALDQYLTGDVWGYVIKDKDGETIDSCWGFYGHDYCETEGKSMLAYLDKKDAQFLLPGVVK